jgi:hypothetical protein
MYSTTTNRKREYKTGNITKKTKLTGFACSIIGSLRVMPSLLELQVGQASAGFPQHEESRE